ncbi:MAG: CHAT domain-containing tetratricopeptide repeat protein [Bacteroidales bacterium]
MFCNTPEEQGSPPQAEEYNKRGRESVRSGDFDNAYRFFQKAIQEDTAYLPSYNNLGIFFRLREKYDESLEYFDKAQKLILSWDEPDESVLARIYNNMGIVYKDKGDYFKALKYYENALNIFLKDPEDIEMAAQVYINLGNIYIKQSEYEKALDVFMKSSQIKGRYAPREWSVSLANIANAYIGLGRLDKAENFYRKAIHNREKYYGKEHYRLGEYYINLYNVLVRQGRDDEGKLFLEKAQFIYDKNFGEMSPFHANIYLFRGLEHEKTGAHEQACAMFHNALISSIESYDDTNFYKNPAMELISPEVQNLEILRSKAGNLFEFYKMVPENKALLHSCFATYDLLLDMIDRMRGGYLNEQSKLFLTKNVREGLNDALQAAHHAYRVTGSEAYKWKAFRYSEKSKSALLSSALSDDEKKNTYGISSEIQMKEKNILLETDFYEKKIYEERQKVIPDAEKIALWQSKLLELSQEYDRVMDHLKESYPDYYALKYGSKIPEISGIQDFLGSNRALLAYSLTDSVLFSFAITDRVFEVVAKDIDSSFYDMLSSAITTLRNNQFGNMSYEEFREYVRSSHTLYTFLLQDLEPVISGKRLIIIPDNQLGYLPFESLLTRMPDDPVFDFRPLAYLVREHPISYSYSATMMMQQNRKSGQKDIELLAFAPTYENIDEIDTFKFVTSRDYKSYLVPLNFVKQEIENITGIIPGVSFVDYDATEEKFWHFGRDYDILHFAMHTLINDEQPMYSQLVFTLTNDSLETNDGLLNTYEIYNADLNAELAVLSACNTGYGKLQKGEGIMSLARGFIYAGVPSIVMTLWAVEDRSGSILMSGFYDQMARGVPLDIALQQAKLNYLEESGMLTAHPYLWSGYVCIGDNHALYKRQKAVPWWATALGLVIILVPLLWYFRKGLF